MLTRSDIARLLTSGLRTEFMKGVASVATVFQEFTTEVPSNKASEVYDWLGSTPSLREWIDERAPKALIENGFSLKNKSYEATIAVDRNAIDDDQYGQIKIRAQQMGAVAREGYDRFAAQVVEAGVSSVCYDGQNFFDTLHQEGTSGVQVNYSASGKPLSAQSVKDVMVAMALYKNDQGQLAGINATHIMVPSTLIWTAQELFDPAAVGVTQDPAKAVLRGRLKVIENRYLSGAAGANAGYYVMDLSKPMKPFIFQNRKPLTLEALEQGENAFMRKKIFYGVDARFAFGYGDWKQAYLAKG